MSKLLREMKKVNSLSEIKQEFSSMEDIFHLQEMYNVQKEEEEIEKELKKLGYIK